MRKYIVGLFLSITLSVSAQSFDDVYSRYYVYEVDDYSYSANLRRFYQPVTVIGYYNYRYVYPLTYTTFDPFWNVNVYIGRRPFRRWNRNNFWYGYPTYTVTTYSGWYTPMYNMNWYNYGYYNAWNWNYNNYNWNYNCNTYYNPTPTNNNVHYGPRQSGVSTGGRIKNVGGGNNTVTNSNNNSGNNRTRSNNTFQFNNNLNNNNSSINNNRQRTNTTNSNNSAIQNNNTERGNRVKDTPSRVDKPSNATQRGNSNSSNLNNNTRKRD